MKKLNLTITLLLGLSIISAKAATINIDGRAILKGQDVSDSISILFERAAPSYYSALTYTDGTGNFNIPVEKGIYNITYAKKGYWSVLLKDKELYNSTSLTDTLLIPIQSRINVPSDFASIQDAIDIAGSGDTIIVERGTYVENINFNGKDLILASNFLFTRDNSDISNTIIDGNQNGHVVEFSHNETSNAQLIGFKIMNGKTKKGGYAEYSQGGGGICCFNSSPTLSFLIVNNNSTTPDPNGYCYGGGIFLYGSNSSLSNLIVEYNTTNHFGGGIGIDESSNPTIINSTIRYNSASQGGGIMTDDGASPTLKNLIIANNSTTNYGGGISLEGSAIIENSIIADNISNYAAGGILCQNGDIIIRNVSLINNSANEWGSGIFLGGTNSIIISNCIFRNNSSSADIYNYSSAPCRNITIENSDFFNTNPIYFYNIDNKYLGKSVTTNESGIACDAYYNIFVDPMINGDYSLQKNSPCIDGGTNDGVSFELDLAGNERIFDGNDNGTDIIDMGAYEYGSEPVVPNIDYSITGSVLADEGKLSGGIALLFKATANYYLPTDYSLITDGDYYFNVEDSGQYIIYVMPDSSSKKTFLPTYYVSEAQWQDATHLNVNGKLYSVDIRMISLSDKVDENGEINGYVSYSDSSQYENEFYKSIDASELYNKGPINVNPINPAQNIVVSLFNDNDIPIDWTISNEAGYFEFKHLPLTKYKLTAQKPGFDLSIIPEIDLNVENDSIGNVSVEINKGQISVNIDEMAINGGAWLRVFPNPVASDLKLELNPGNSNNLNLRIVNVQGKVVYNSDIAVNPSEIQTVTFPLVGIQAGIYYGIISTDENNRTFKFIKTKN